MARRRSGRRWPLTVVLAVVALGSSAARADDDHARELFKQGTVYFDLSQYDRAIEVWQRGYEEKQDPGFLYNIAQAYRLWGNPEKAVAFYKSFLRNAPRAENRAEIEEKIAALQKQIAEGGGRTPAPDRLAAGGGLRPEAASGPQAVAPSPLAPGAGVPPSSATTPPAAVAGAADGVPQPSPDSGGRIDVGAAAGGTVWLSGTDGSGRPGFAFALRGGANLASDPGGPVGFRLGGVIGYSRLSDPSGRISLISVLAEPAARIRLGSDRWFLHTGVGVGVVVVAGLTPQSTLLVRDRRLAVDGTQSLLELRPRLELECRLSRTVGVSLGPSLAYTPKRTYYYEPWLRLHLLAAFTFTL